MVRCLDRPHHPLFYFTFTRACLLVLSFLAGACSTTIKTARNEAIDSCGKRDLISPAYLLVQLFFVLFASPC